MDNLGPRGGAERGGERGGERWREVEREGAGDLTLVTPALYQSCNN